MAETLRAGLSMSHSGFGYWSHDISGFESTAPADVYKRWVQFGLLSYPQPSAWLDELPRAVAV